MDIGGYENFKDFKDKAQQAINFVLPSSYYVFLFLFFIYLYFFNVNVSRNLSNYAIFFVCYQKIWFILELHKKSMMNFNVSREKNNEIQSNGKTLAHPFCDSWFKWKRKRSKENVYNLILFCKGALSLKYPWSFFSSISLSLTCFLSFSRGYLS